MIFASLKHLKAFADFRLPLDDRAVPRTPVSEMIDEPEPRRGEVVQPQSLGLNLGYTINLNLPATSDPEVFDAIFKSLKQHLLRAEDA